MCKAYIWCWFRAVQNIGWDQKKHTYREQKREWLHNKSCVSVVGVCAAPSSLLQLNSYIFSCTYLVSFLPEFFKNCFHFVFRCFFWCSCFSFVVGIFVFVVCLLIRFRSLFRGPILTLWEPQSRLGDEVLGNRVVCPQNGTAILGTLFISIWFRKKQVCVLSGNGVLIVKKKQIRNT